MKHIKTSAYIYFKLPKTQSLEIRYLSIARRQICKKNIFPGIINSKRDINLCDDYLDVLPLKSKFVQNLIL